MRMPEIQSALAVVQYQSYAEAAEMTHQATSTISKHVKRLEQELGVRLFERGGRQEVELTERGKVVLPYLQLMAGDYQKMQDYARDYVQQQARNLSIGYIPLLGTTGESEILARFQIQCPDACVTHVLMENAALWQLLMQRKIDGAFFFTIGRPNRISAPWSAKVDADMGVKQIFRSRKLYIGVGENHRWANRSSILSQELEDETCVFNNISDHMKKDISNLILNMVSGDKTRIPFRVRYMSFAYRPAVYALIREGLGVLPQCCIPQSDVPGIRFIPVSDINIDARTRFIYWKSSSPRIMSRLLSAIDQYTKEGGNVL